MSTLRIRRCANKRDFKQFERLPEELHRNDSCFIPPFPGSVAAFFDPKHPFNKHNHIRPFIAERDGRGVGRIAAIVNTAHNQHSNDEVGFFGFCDFADDAEVANALFVTAAAELRAAGRVAMRGPYSPSSNDECGLLVRGFDTPPMVLMPYNPPYYEARYEAYGLTQCRDLHSYRLTDPATAFARTERIAERLKRNAGFTVRSVNLNRFDDEIATIHSLYNETLKRQWGFVPVSFEELHHAASDLKQVLDPKLVLFAEKEGKPVGLSVCVPNINEFMDKAKHSRGLLRVLRFVWNLKTKKPKAVRLAILGVLPGERNKGIAPAFYFESLKRGVGRYTEAEMGWVLDNNDEVNKAAKLLGAQRHKTHRIYEMALV